MTKINICHSYFVTPKIPANTWTELVRVPQGLLNRRILASYGTIPTAPLVQTKPLLGLNWILTLQAIARYLAEYCWWDERNIFPPPNPFAFSNIQNHWARDRIREMSTQLSSKDE